MGDSRYRTAKPRRTATPVLKLNRLQQKNLKQICTLADERSQLMSIMARQSSRFYTNLCAIISRPKKLCLLFNVQQLYFVVYLRSKLSLGVSFMTEWVSALSYYEISILWQQNLIPLRKRLLVCLFLRPTIRLFAVYLRSDGMSFGESIMTQQQASAVGYL